MIFAAAILSLLAGTVGGVAYNLSRHKDVIVNWELTDDGRLIFEEN